MIEKVLLSLTPKIDTYVCISFYRKIYFEITSVSFVKFVITITVRLSNLFNFK